MSIPTRFGEIGSNRFDIFPQRENDSQAMCAQKNETPDLVKNSVLYKEFLAEREEILRHKWIESEKLGHDIGFERALLDWIVKYRSAWRSDRTKAQPKTDRPLGQP